MLITKSFLYVTLSTMASLLLFFTSFSAMAKQDKAHEVAIECLANRLPIPLLDPNLSTFSLQNTNAMALLSALAYQKPDFVKRIGLQLGFAKVDYFTKTRNDLNWKAIGKFVWDGLVGEHQRLIIAHTSGYWFENDDVIVVSFMGTDSDDILNLVTDAMAKKVPFGTIGKVHPGFYGAAHIAWRQIYERYLKVGKAKPIIFTGHSLGAGIATIAAVHLLNSETRELEGVKLKSPGVSNIAWNKPYVAALYTFGSPEAGDVAFETTANRLFSQPRIILVPSLGGPVAPPTPISARFVNNEDIVPKVPGIPSYRHIWAAYSITTDDTIALVSDRHREDVKFDRPLLPLFRNLRAAIEEGLKFHGILNYLTKLMMEPELINTCSVPLD